MTLIGLASHDRWQEKLSQFWTNTQWFLCSCSLPFQRDDDNDKDKDEHTYTNQEQHCKIAKGIIETQWLLPKDPLLMVYCINPLFCLLEKHA